MQHIRRVLGWYAHAVAIMYLFVAVAALTRYGINRLGGMHAIRASIESVLISPTHK
jgi:hypothetical protein